MSPWQLKQQNWRRTIRSYRLLFYIIKSLCGSTGKLNSLGCVTKNNHIRFWYEPDVILIRAFFFPVFCFDLTDSPRKEVYLSFTEYTMENINVMRERTTISISHRELCSVLRELHSIHAPEFWGKLFPILFQP